MRRTISLAAALATALALLPRPAPAVPPAFAPGQRLLCDPATTLCPKNRSRTEPAVRVDANGQAWVTDQMGIVVGGPGGVNLWRRPTPTAPFSFHAKVDEIPVVTQRNGYALGGGDSDLAIGSTGNVYTASLWAGSVTFAAYDKDGVLLHRTYVSGLANMDRHWLAAYGPSTVWMTWWDLTGPNSLYAARSDDAGLTWAPPVVVSFSVGSLGNVVVDQADGTVYTLYASGSTLSLGRCKPLPAAGCEDAAGLGALPWFENRAVYTPTGAPGDPGSEFGTLFPAVALDKAGNLYVVWSDQNTIWLAVSQDRGDTWTHPVAVSSPSNSVSAVFPWVVAGSPGRAGIVWLGSLRATPDTEGTTDPWYAYYAQSINALSGAPTFEVVQASDDPVHNADICLKGLGCDLGTVADVRDGLPGGIGGALESLEESLPEVVKEMVLEPAEFFGGVFANNRDLAEVVTLAIDSDGHALAAFPDDWECTGNPPCTFRKVVTRSVVAKQTAGEPLVLP